MPNILSSVFNPTTFNTAWDYKMGMKFQATTNGNVTALGGNFNGTKTVTLYNATFNVLASATVTSANAWAYTAITPVALTSGSIYYVVVSLAGSGGAYGSISCPVTSNGITILDGVYQSPSAGNLSAPTLVATTMYGCADITFANDTTPPSLVSVNVSGQRGMIGDNYWIQPNDVLTVTLRGYDAGVGIGSCYGLVSNDWSFTTHSYAYHNSDGTTTNFALQSSSETKVQPVSALRTEDGAYRAVQWGFKGFSACANMITAGIFDDRLGNRLGWFDTGVKITVADSLSAQLIGHTIPSNMFVGTTYPVTVTMKNTGGTPWTQATNFKLGAWGDSDPSYVGNKVLLDVGDNIAYGQSKTFSFNLTPTSSSSYTSDWRMVQEGSAWFGDTLNVAVTVANRFFQTGSDTLALADGMTNRFITWGFDVMKFDDTTSKFDSLTGSMALFQNGADSLSLVDDFNKMAGQNSSEALSLLENIVAMVSAFTGESLSLNDGLRSDMYTLLLDSVLMTDASSAVITKLISDIIPMVDLLMEGISSDDIIPTLELLTILVEKLLSESVAVNDAYMAEVNSSKDEVLSLIEFFGINVDKVLPTDMVGLIDEQFIRDILEFDEGGNQGLSNLGVTDALEGRKFLMLQQVFINGVQVPVVGLKIQHSVKDRVSTCTFTIHAPSQDVIALCQHRTEIHAYLVDGEGNTDYFGGRIVQNPVSGRTAVSSQLEITADDWTALANDVLICESYSSTSGTLTDILKIMWTKYYQADISFDGVIDTDKTLDSLTFNYDSLFDATETFANLLGWVWYVEWNGSQKVLRFYPPSSAVKAVTLSIENRNVVAGTAKFGQNESICNSVYVFGGDGTSAPFTESMVADGQKRAYSLGTRPNRVDKTQPITIKVNGGAVLTWGYINVSDPNAFDVLIDFDNKVVLWRDNNKPALNAIISMTYTFTYPILVHLTDDVSISKFGLAEQRIQDSKITTAQNAREIGKAFLRDNSLPLGYGSCEIYVEGLRAGDFITVNLPKYNVNGLFEIIEIEKWIESSRVKRTVSLNLADNVENRIAKRLKEFTVRLASLEAGQRPSDIVLQRVIRNPENLSVSFVGKVKGNVTYNVGDSLSIGDLFLHWFLRSGNSIRNDSFKESLGLIDTMGKVVKTTKQENSPLSDSFIVRKGSSLFGIATFGGNIFGAEVTG